MIANESQALTVVPPAELSLGHPIPSVVARFTYLREVLAKVMQEGADYGTIPGLGDRRSLFKSGAEKLCTAFGLAPRLEIDRRDLADNHREYEVKCSLVHIGTGNVVAEGVGCCSTMESRYRWRKSERACPDCGKPTIIRGRAEYGGGWVCYAKKGGCGSKWPDGARVIEGQQAGRVENPDIADVYNTVLKIAKKRAQVDATLTAVGASDLLTQDLEDIAVEDREPTPQPQAGPPASAVAHDDRRAVPLGAAKDAERPASARAQAKSEPGEDWQVAMVGKIDEAETVDALKALAPVINQMTPAGSRARKMLKRCYEERLANLEPKGA